MQRIVAALLSRQTHNTVIPWHLMAESCTTFTCNIQS